jgi:hypothetical protein
VRGAVRSHAPADQPQPASSKSSSPPGQTAGSTSGEEASARRGAAPWSSTATRVPGAAAEGTASSPQPTRSKPRSTNASATERTPHSTARSASGPSVETSVGRPRGVIREFGRQHVGQQRRLVGARARRLCAMHAREERPQREALVEQRRDSVAAH